MPKDPSNILKPRYAPALEPEMAAKFYKALVFGTLVNVWAVEGLWDFTLEKPSPGPMHHRSAVRDASDEDVPKKPCHEALQCHAWSLLLFAELHLVFHFRWWLVVPSFLPSDATVKPLRLEAYSCATKHQRLPDPKTPKPENTSDRRPAGASPS